jgi:hypothetical protein
MRMNGNSSMGAACRRHDKTNVIEFAMAQASLGAPMKRAISLIFTLSSAQIGIAQLSDKGAIERASGYIEKLAPDVRHEAPRVWRDSFDVRGHSIGYLQVFFGEVSVGLMESGEFLSYADSRGGSPRDGAPDKHATEEEAWAALEETLSEVDLGAAEDLHRSSFTQQGSAYSDSVNVFYFRPRPYGYEHSSGNYVAAVVHRITGKLIGLSVARGWTYEAPDIRVTEEQAVQKAIEQRGGQPADWVGRQLRYASMDYERAPEYLKPMIARQEMRLMYIMSAKRGVVMIDSVTGAVVDTWQYDDAEGRGTSSGGAEDARPRPESESGLEGDRRSPWLLPVLGVGALFVVGFGVVVAKARRRGRALS